MGNSREEIMDMRFGRCGYFIIHDTDTGHRPGFFPQFLNDLGAEITIVGGMGERAQQLFNENNIDVIVGARGECGGVMKHFIDGTLVSTGSVCINLSLC